MSIEEKAKEYARNCYPYDGEMQFQCEYHYKSGWDEALKNQWIKVEERTPKVEEYVLVMIEYEGSIQIHLTMYLGETNWLFADVKIIAWMPIPSFDDILEANKGVLEWLKDK